MPNEASRTVVSSDATFCSVLTKHFKYIGLLPMEISIEETKSRFIEQKGMEYQAEGLPRIAGKIVGLLIIEDGPFSFSKLAEGLQVSRGSISTNTRLLENIGLIDRISLPGQRGDFFQLAPRPYRSMLEGICARLDKALANPRQAQGQLLWQIHRQFQLLK